MSEASDRSIAARPGRRTVEEPPGGLGHDGQGDGHGGHGSGPEEIHLPPNSWVPISVALALTVLFIGFLQERPFNYLVCLIGGAWLVASLVGWYTGARSEYRELH
ncbi:MAG: hypothetical protein ABR541_06685 [Candidatus Dormibacteria bacterium]